MTGPEYNLARDSGVVVLGIVVAFFFAKTGLFVGILTSTQELEFIGSFVAGLFFTSIFTAAPATVVLAEMARANSVLGVAFLGGLGALVGDFIIYRFVKNNLSSDLSYLVKRLGGWKIILIFKSKFFGWLVPFVGALVIASPLPDELGLTMMGLSKIKTSLFIPLSFSLNFFGILIIGLIAQHI